MSSAVVNKIIPFSSVDGPGNRTAVFLQGCNFDCRYCHNPETRNLCIGCGDCVDTCPAGALTMEAGSVHYDITKCCNCDTCIRTCQHGCSPKVRIMTPEQVFAEIRKQQPFIRGITVSGGECTLYPEFLRELFVLCRDAGLGTLIDSNGTLDFEAYPKLLEVADGVMLDIKAFPEEEHRTVTGADNAMVLKNAVFLAGCGKLYEIRTVIVPELFDTERTVRETAKLLAPYLKVADIRYKLITYRPMGVREEYSHYRVPSKEELSRLSKIAKEEGFQTVLTIDIL